MIRDERKPVKALRAILLLAVVAAAVAYSGISGRRHDDEKLKQWTEERAVPPVAVVAPQARRRDARTRAARQCRRLLQRRPYTAR